MISITIAPQSAAHIDIMASAMKALLDSMTPPTAQVAEPAEMAKAISHAEEIKEEKAKAPKPAKAPASTPSEVAADTQPASATATTQPAPVASPETATASPSSQIEYAQVSKAITEMVKNNRDHAVTTLAKYGAKKGTELKPEDYAAFLKELG